MSEPEAKDARENVGVSLEDIVRKAEALYRASGNDPEKIPEEELVSLRLQIQSLPEAEWKQLRQDLGEATLAGKTKVREEAENPDSAKKDIGPAAMEILFGKRDAALLKNVQTICGILDTLPRHYKIGGLLELYEWWQNWQKAGHLAKLPEDKAEEARQAGNGIKLFFLSGRAGPSAQEKMSILQEVQHQNEIREKVSAAFAEAKTPERLITQLSETRKQITDLWHGFRLSSFSEAQPIISRILFQKRLAQELEAKINNKEGDQPSLSPTEKTNIDRGTALLFLARQLKEEAILALPEKATELLRKAEAYEEKAQWFLNTASPQKGGAK